MRVITGTARGRRLLTPQGSDVRPTVDRVKEGIFSALQFDIEGRRVLDLFAGSGQLGIEALSRGAARCTFVDSAKPSLDCVHENIRACGFAELSAVKQADSLVFLQTCADEFDIAFLDPPYKHGIIEKALPLLVPHMSNYGVIVCEHASDEPLPSGEGSFRAVREYRYGKVLVTVYKKSQTT